MCIYHVSGPKYPLAGRGSNGSPAQSAFFVYTVLPHHARMLLAPIVPFFGNWSLERGACVSHDVQKVGSKKETHTKKMNTTESAKPESMAADRT